MVLYSSTAVGNLCAKRLVAECRNQSIEEIVILVLHYVGEKVCPRPRVVVLQQYFKYTALP